MEIIETTEKKKRGRPRKYAPDENIKSPTKQFPLTFKCNSELEMDLYNHLYNKIGRGTYIKEILVQQMLQERPDLAEKYGVHFITHPFTPPVVPPVPEPTPEPDALAGMDEGPTPVIDEVEEIPYNQEQHEEDEEDEPAPAPRIKRGTGTLGMF